MKINLFALGRAVRTLIITAAAFSLTGLLLCPELVQYTPENSELLCHQRGFALACIVISAFAGALIYWESVKND
jgi:hypothetical protein